MTGLERALTYRTAIQTGLRAAELRSLTRGRLYLNAKRPYVLCAAGSTKNRKQAQQFIDDTLAAELKTHVAAKSPQAPVFSLPYGSNLARMLRDDVAAARKAWLQEPELDADKRLQREQSDFLAVENHDGQRLDFHSLRHTCGAWLAQAGAHAKTVQAIMRHSTITLTMDTYGHLFPGSEADAVVKMSDMLAGPPEALRATGTDHTTAEIAQRQAQRAGRDRGRQRAMDCAGPDEGPAHEESPKPLRVADLGDGLRQDAPKNKSRAGGTRTPNQQIMSLLL